MGSPCHVCGGDGINPHGERGADCLECHGSGVVPNRSNDTKSGVSKEEFESVRRTLRELILIVDRLAERSWERAFNSTDTAMMMETRDRLARLRKEIES